MYLQIGNFQLPSYGVFIVVGVLIANLIALYGLRKYSLNIYDLMIIEAYTFMGAFMGAKLLYLWVSRDLIDWQHFFEVSYFSQLMQGGFVFYGGLIGGIIFSLLAGKIHKINSVLYIRKFIFLIPIIHGFGRVGCHLAGCCYGKPYDGLFSIVYSTGTFAPAGISLFPIQLVESFCLFLMGIVLFLIQKNNYHINSLELYLILYSVLRFILEYFRYDSERGSFLFFSTSQWISVGIIIFIIIKNVIRPQNGKWICAGN